MSMRHALSPASGSDGHGRRTRPRANESAGSMDGDECPPAAAPRSTPPTPASASSEKPAVSPEPAGSKARKARPARPAAASAAAKGASLRREKGPGPTPGRQAREPGTESRPRQPGETARDEVDGDEGRERHDRAKPDCAHGSSPPGRPPLRRSRIKRSSSSSAASSDPLTESRNRDRIGGSTSGAATSPRPARAWPHQQGGQLRPGVSVAVRERPAGLAALEQPLASKALERGRKRRIGDGRELVGRCRGRSRRQRVPEAPRAPCAPAVRARRRRQHVQLAVQARHPQGTCHRIISADGRILHWYNVWLCKNLACLRRSSVEDWGTVADADRTTHESEQKAKYSGNTR